MMYKLNSVLGSFLKLEVTVFTPHGESLLAYEECVLKLLSAGEGNWASGKWFSWSNPPLDLVQCTW